MNNNRMILALDVGERRIGVAAASTEARLASPLKTLERQDGQDIVPEIISLALFQDASIIVVGLPRGLDGQETGQTSIARAFAADLQRQAPNLTIVMQDEAGTSVQAETLLRERGKPFSKGDIDSEAACIILRDYLQQAVEHSA